jgi:hypothetical protein
MDSIGHIVSDALAWESIKFVLKMLAGAVLMTGAGAFILSGFNRLKKKPEKIAYWVGTPALLFIFLLLIRDNQAPAPALKGSIEAVYTLQLPPNSGRALGIIESISNVGSMPSIAYFWKVTLKHGAKSIDCPTSDLPEKFDIFLPAKGSFPARTVTYFHKDSIMLKALSPIPPGGLITGMLVCELKDLDISSLKEDDEVIVSFFDVSKETHTASIQGSSQYKDLIIFPGMTQEVK